MKCQKGYRLVSDGLIKTDASEPTGDRKPLTIYKAISEEKDIFLGLQHSEESAVIEKSLNQKKNPPDPDHC